MKKFVSILFVVIFVLTACQVTQTEPTVVEQPVQVTEQTIEPTVVVTEKPTEFPASEEPIDVPTEEPTPEPLPDICPVEALEVAKHEDMVIDFGEFGIDQIGRFVIPNDETFYASYLMYNGKSGLDENLINIMQEGGKFSFKMPSAGIMYIPVHDTVVRVNGDTWNTFIGDVIMSPEGGMIIPTGAEIEIETEGGIEQDGLMLLISFLSGKQINSQDIKLHDMALLSCGEFWLLTIKNSSSEEVVVPLDIGFSMLLKDYDGLLAMADQQGELPFEYIERGMTIHNGDLVTLEAGGYIDLFVMDWYPYE